MKRLRRSLPRSVAVVALAAAIVFLAVLQVNTRHQLQQTQQGNRAVAAVLAAPDARIETSSTTVGGTVTAVIAPHAREAVITTADMPAPADARSTSLGDQRVGRALGRTADRQQHGRTSRSSPPTSSRATGWGSPSSPLAGRRATTTPIVLLAAND